MEDREDQIKKVESPIDGDDGHYRGSPTTHHHVLSLRVVVSILLLFVNYFLAQYDKFILSYFQAEVISSLVLSSSEYGILSGYATGIVYALLALPTAFIADFTEARVWVLSPLVEHMCNLPRPESQFLADPPCPDWYGHRPSSCGGSQC